MVIPPGESPCKADAEGRLWQAAVPFVLGTFCFLIGLFFVRPNLGEPDSYREALSAFQYIEEGIYSSYWDHPLTMYVFVVTTRLALALHLNQTVLLNAIAVLLGAISVWPFYQLMRRLLNRETAAFASAALILYPTFIRFSTYLSHEIVGFTFALWSLYLFERTLAEQTRTDALAFGLSYGATWSARPNGALFIALPLLVLLLHKVERFKLTAAGKLLPFSLLGFFGCLVMVYRPALVEHLASFSGKFLFTFYKFGRYSKSTSLIALESLTPVLLVLTAIGCCALILRRRYFVALFAGIWILATYLFYTGMYSMHRYFLVLLPPCLLLCFAGADQIDHRLRLRNKRLRHGAKVVALLLLLSAGLGPNLPDLLYIRRVNDDKVAAEEIGKLVGTNLLFTTSPEPMIRYYNRENPPETVYLVTEHSPGRVAMKLDALVLAQERLREGRPVFVTHEILVHFARIGVDAELEPVWEYKSLRMYRLISLEITGKSFVHEAS